MEWIHKKNYLGDMIDKVVNQVTDQLETASFFLDTDFFWNDLTTNAQKKENWSTINKPLAPNEQPRLPLTITDQGHYITKKEELEGAYDNLNKLWKSTREKKILLKLENIRTDKYQYETNLKSLTNNDVVLREKIKTISGQLYPSFPDTKLYSSLFFNKDDRSKPPDLTLAALLAALESNTVYYHQELGKFNQLKKEECHLVERYKQIQTRMKLWIARERLRLFTWELYYSTAYVFKDFDGTSIYPIYNPEPYDRIEINDRKRNFQCVDFCQCEFGCPNLIRMEGPPVVKK